MSESLTPELGLQILAGVGLAAAAGLRAFLPPFLVGVLARLDVLPLRSGLDWLESTPSLVIFGTAVVVEILADKIPVVDHALDSVSTVLKPAAGALMLGSTLLDLPPLPAAILALVVGGGVAGTVHVTKSGLRLASSGTTGGLANPVLSMAEDGLSFGSILVAVFAPVLVIGILLVGALLLWRVIRWMRARAAARAPVT